VSRVPRDTGLGVEAVASYQRLSYSRKEMRRISRQRKVDECFSHASDVTSLKTPVYFIIVFNVNMKRHLL